MRPGAESRRSETRQPVPPQPHPTARSTVPDPALPAETWQGAAAGNEMTTTPR